MFAVSIVQDVKQNDFCFKKFGNSRDADFSKLTNIPSSVTSVYLLGTGKQRVTLVLLHSLSLQQNKPSLCYAATVCSCAENYKFRSLLIWSTVFPSGM